jgi:acetyl esterase/lipase
MPTEWAALLPRLDPELVYAAEHQPDVTHPDPQVARRLFTRAFKLSRATRGAAYGADRVAVEDSSFQARDDGREIGIRVYRPRGAATPAPVLVFFHGALLAGDVDTEHARCLRFATEAGCAVVSVDYRKPPEHKYPAPTDDCFAAVDWVHRTAAGWGGDPRRIAVAGSSSGALLAAAVALLARDRGGPRLALQMLLYPTIDDRQQTASSRAFSLVGRVSDDRWVWRHYLGDDPAIMASPQAVPARCDDFTRVAPAYVLIAEVDPLRDEALDYATRMMRDGVRVELHLMAGTFHGFDAAAPGAEISRRSLEEQCAALRWAFGVVEADEVVRPGQSSRPASGRS